MKPARRALLIPIIIVAVCLFAIGLNGGTDDTALATPSPTSAAVATASPTLEPTPTPTAEPTPTPTPSPTAKSTPSPTAEPTSAPTAEPTPEATTEPTADPTPVPTADSTPAPTEEPVTYIKGYPSNTEVYVSQSSHKIHLRSNCSGMKNYTTMTLGEAESRGYEYCSNCFN
ncbi:MAG: hypothetical protein LUC89_05110 [Oscillospiraceae bacterium]|nr:hypothetical protein [Oscillospiraceae bacterium]